MGFNSLFIWGIVISVLVLLFGVFKTMFKTQHLKKNIKHNHVILQKKIIEEHSKLEKNKEKMQLLEGLHKTLFNRLFKITKEIILLQSIIFETHTK